MGALSKIKTAGFDVSLYGDSFKIAPADKLTMQQREFLKLHKAEIITELKDCVELPEGEEQKNIIVICYSPSGLVYEVEATSPEHADFLRRMNPSRN